MVQVDFLDRPRFHLPVCMRIPAIESCQVTPFSSQPIYNSIVCRRPHYPNVGSGRQGHKALTELLIQNQGYGSRISCAHRGNLPGGRCRYKRLALAPIIFG